MNKQEKSVIDKYVWTCFSLKLNRFDDKHKQLEIAEITFTLKMKLLA